MALASGGVGAQPTAWSKTLTLTSTSVSTVAGNSTAGLVDGTGGAAEFDHPYGMTVWGGFGYVWDSYYIRKVNLATGAVTTWAGTGTNPSCLDSTNPLQAQVSQPDNAMTSTDGQYLYWMDLNCTRAYPDVDLRSISLSTGAVHTYPGITGNGVVVGPGGTIYTSDSAGDINVANLATDSETVLTTLPQSIPGHTYPQNILGLAADSTSIWVSSLYNDQNIFPTEISSVNPTTGGVTVVVAPSETQSLPRLDGTLVSAGAYLYLTSGTLSQVLRITKSSGGINYIAGQKDVYGFQDGLGASAAFYAPEGIDTDGANLYLTDNINYRVREIGQAPPPTSGLPTGTTGAYLTTGLSPAELAAGGNAAEVCKCAVHQATSSPVNTSTGAFWHSFTDLTLSGRGPGLNVSRTYSSANATQTSIFGHGWSWSYGISLTQDPSNGGDVTVHQEDGSTIAFAPTAGSAMTPLEPRMLATLVHNDDNTYTFTRQQRTIMTFNAAGQLTSVADLNGNATTLTYNGSGVLTTITDSSGRAYTVTVTGSVITKITDPAGRYYTYGYSAAGDLTSVTDPTNAVWTFTYDTSHRLLTMLDPNQQGAAHPVPLTNVYDSSGRVTSQTDYAGRVTTFDYTSIAGATKITDPAGDVTVDYYANGLRTKTTVGYGTSAAATTSYTYDPTTFAVASVTDPLNHTTIYTYDANGNQLTATDPLGRVTTSTYDPLNDVLTVTDGTGVTTTNSYDGNGNLLSTSTPLLSSGGTVLATRTTTYTYGDPTHPGDVTAVTDPNGNITRYARDTYGDITTVTAPPTPENATGDVTTSTYNTTTGWLTSTVSPKGNVSGGTPANYTTSYGYDSDGRPTYTRDSLWTASAPTLHQTATGYDLDGNVTSRTDADGNTTSYAYDLDNELLTTTQPDHSTLSTTWSADGMVLTTTDAATHTTTYTYDPRNDVATSKTPAGKTTTYTYDLAGNLTLEAAPGATCTGTPTAGCTSLTYDKDNELTARSYLDGVTHAVTAITYDNDGRRTAQTDATGTTTWAYDSLGRLTSSTDGHGTTISYGYDLAGNETSITYPGTSHTVTRTYDALNRLSTVSDWSGNTTTYAYDADSNPLTTTFPSGTSETDTNTYNQLDELTGIADKKSTTTLAGFTYTRDSAGQLLTSITTGISEPNQTYTYNSLQQLTASGSATTPTSYAYTAGNDISNRGTTSGGTANTQTYKADDQLCWSIATTITSPACTTTPTGATTYTFNASGDRTQASTPGATTPNTITTDVTTSKDGTGTGATNTTSSFSTTGSNEVLLALVSAGGASGTAQSETISGAGVTWTRVQQANTQTGDSEIWKAAATSPLTNVTVTATETHSGYHQTLTVIALKNAASTGATKTANAATGAPSLTLTSTAAGSLTFAAGNDPTAATHRTLGTGQTLTHEYTDTVSATDSWAQHTTSPTSSSGGTVTINDTAPTTDKWNLVAAEVVPTTTTAAASTSTYSYDEANNLTSYTSPASVTTTYAYDGDGLRQSKTTSGTTSHFTWDHSTAIPDLLADNTNYYIYGQDNLPLEQIAIAGGTTSYLHHDQIGSTRLLTNSTGATVGTATYDPYGNPVTITGTTTPLGYTGQYTDKDTGLIYLRARYYDPTTGQLLTIDPALTTTGQPYQYAADSPVDNQDPTGLVSVGGVLSTIDDLDPMSAMVNGFRDEWNAVEHGCSTTQAIAMGVGGTLESATNIYLLGDGGGDASALVSRIRGALSRLGASSASSLAKTDLADEILQTEEENIYQSLVGDGPDALNQATTLIRVIGVEHGGPVGIGPVDDPGSLLPFVVFVAAVIVKVRGLVGK